MTLLRHPTGASFLDAFTENLTLTVESFSRQ